MDFVILTIEAPRDILTITPDGFFIRGDCTDEEYLAALELFNELGIEWDGERWVKA